MVKVPERNEAEILVKHLGEWQDDSLNVSKSEQDSHDANQKRLSKVYELKYATL